MNIRFTASLTLAFTLTFIMTGTAPADRPLTTPAPGGPRVIVSEPSTGRVSRPLRDLARDGGGTGPTVGVGRGEPLTPAQQAAEKDRQVQDLIGQATGPDEHTRAWAINQLGAMGEAALPKLKTAAAQKNLSKETQARFEALITILEADAKTRPAMKKKILVYAGAEHGELFPIVDSALAQAFPKHVFYVLRFRLFPVARMTPEGLKPSNVFVVAPDGAAQLLADSDATKKFFETALRAVTNAAAARRAAQAWIRLAQEWSHDGFYRFEIPPDAVTASMIDAGITASAKANVVSGGKGSLSATLTFDQRGKLKTVANAGSVQEGMRPICQATKLLDADPIVRKMAERSIQIMGRAARGYLEEQRAQAAPDLQQAIDRMWQRILEEGW
ncbi:MAG: hypothetical protein EXS33_04655 [Pedosphaera sp.]|nr:hypothetical protein [Pedosphaera sp.]